MKRLVAALAILLGLLAPAVAHAQTAPSCQFVLGFKTLHDMDPGDIGDCTDNQAFAANGDAQQHTTKGLMAWRKADNWTAFTNGYMTWINGPSGLVSRLNTQRFCWEADATSCATSPIWAGYVDTGAVFTGVGARWNTPGFAGSGAEVTWVGIDGWRGQGGMDANGVLQIGTGNVGHGPYAWWEAFPASPEPIDLDIRTDDPVTASIVRQDRGLWLLSLTNERTGATFQRAVQYLAHNSSAEWIQETPTFASSTPSLFPSFGSVTFGDCWYVGGGERHPLSDGHPLAITLSRSGQTLAAPGPLAPNGVGFSVLQPA